MHISFYELQRKFRNHQQILVSHHLAVLTLFVEFSMVGHRAHVNPNLSEFRLDVNQNVLVIVSALVNRLVLIKNAEILV